MIILLTGPTGSGKTDTSWALLDITRDMVFLDCDWFASLAPFSWSKESDVQMVYEALSKMVDFYLQKGHTNFVITLTSEMAVAVEKIKLYFFQKNIMVYCFRLRCDRQELQRRIMKRDRLEAQKQQELKDSIVQQEIFDTVFSDNTFFHLIDGTHKSEQETAHLILERIRV